MLPKQLWAGLDIGETVTNYAVVDDGGSLLGEGEVPTSASGVIEAFGPIRRQLMAIGAEAGVGTHLIRQLRDAGLPIEAYEARRVKAFLKVRRNKTDAIDARGIADVARVGRGVVSQVHIKSIETQRLKSLLKLRHQLVLQRVSVDNMLNSLLVLNGGRRVKLTAARPKENARAEIARMERETGVKIRQEAEMLLDLCLGLRSQVAKLDIRLASMAKDSPVCRRFLEIPGVGPLVALSFYSLIENPHRFANGASIGAYLGLVPRIHQSGANSKILGITKMGDRRTRAMLVTAASVLLRSNAKETALKEWGLALAERAGRKRAHVAVARKLAAVMLSIWKTDRPFEPHARTS